MARIEACSSPNEPEPVLQLWLENTKDGVALRGSGDWHIAIINKNGLKRCGNLNDKYRQFFPLDDELRIVDCTNEK